VFGNNVDATFQLLDAAAGRRQADRLRVKPFRRRTGLVHAAAVAGVRAGDRAASLRRRRWYGLSKLVGELIAETVSRRWGSEVISLRFPFIGAGERLRQQLEHVRRDPARTGRRYGAGSTPATPPGVITALTARVTVTRWSTWRRRTRHPLVPTAELMRRYHPTTRLDGPLDGFAVPFSLELSRELLGFTPVHTWRPMNGGT